MIVRVEEVKPGDRLVTDYSGVQTVEEVWQIKDTPVIEVHYEGGLVQYHTIGEEIEKA